MNVVFSLIFFSRSLERMSPEVGIIRAYQLMSFHAVTWEWPTVAHDTNWLL